jgi:hypothetical protein
MIDLADRPTKTARRQLIAASPVEGKSLAPVAGLERSLSDPLYSYVLADVQLHHVASRREDDPLTDVDHTVSRTLQVVCGPQQVGA